MWVARTKIYTGLGMGYPTFGGESFSCMLKNYIGVDVFV
jgi:hypothetical protein